MQFVSRAWWKALLPAVALLAVGFASNPSAAQDEEPASAAARHVDDGADDGANVPEYANRPKPGQQVARAQSLDGGPVSEADDARRGLGSYGPSGTIRRSDLPADLQGVVSDEALRMANSPSLATARARWNENSDFVDQIDYQLAFRSRFDFLSADADHLGRLLAAKPETMEGTEEMGLFLTPDEAAELKRRDDLGEYIEQIEARLGESPALVAAWIDQMNGGRITVAVHGEIISRRAMRLARAAGVDLHVVQVPYSSVDYERFRSTLSDELTATGMPFRVGTDRSASHYRIEVSIEDAGRLPTDFASSVPADAFQVEQGARIAPAGLPQDDHATADLQPGLMLWLDLSEGWGICTWGINGHTNNWNYVVTAGHCMGQTLWDSSGWVDDGDIEVWAGSQIQNALWDQLTPGDTFVHSRLRNTFDVARISSPNADTNCYHGTTNDWGRDCPWRIENRTLHDRWETNQDRTCSSLGVSNRYRCGLILDEDVELNYGADFDNWSTDRAVEVDYPSVPGDSGSGAKWNHTFDGIIVCCDGTPTSFMVTAYDVKRGLGGSFDFNCSSGFARRDADEWGACPAIDR